MRDSDVRPAMTVEQLERKEKGRVRALARSRRNTENRARYVKKKHSKGR